MKFQKEADLCAAFLKTVPECWTAYSETGGFDILLVHDCGAQIGIEAKLRLNAKVLRQALDGVDSWYESVGPDYRAVLVPHGNDDMAYVAGRLGLTVLMVSISSEGVENGCVNYEPGKKFSAGRLMSRPELPKFSDLPDLKNIWLHQENWHDFSPPKRICLPEFVPDVPAGEPAPRQLSKWKIQALRLTILMDRRGALCPADFRAAQIGMSMWTQNRWLSASGTRGVWLRGEAWPGQRWKNEHAGVFSEIEADFYRWIGEVKLSSDPLPMQEVLL